MHQRLVMHCLAEASGSVEIREELENRLSQWLLFECRFTGKSQLTSEMEFPERALSIAFNEGSDVIEIILRSLQRRAIIPPGIIAAIAARLEDQYQDVRGAAIQALRAQSALPTETVTAIVARLENEDWGVRHTAIKALHAQSALPAETVAAIAARLEDEDKDVRWAAIQALQALSALPAETATAIAARLEDWGMGRAVSDILRLHTTLYYTLLRGSYAHLLYRTALRESFEEQQSWYIDGSHFYVSTPEQITESPIHPPRINIGAMFGEVKAPNMSHLLAS
ncbi:uncharacterized protein B0I36DRAFT_300306 [Microdochium trichocladiopsis]|uniref:HEAT repeat domain-containing protein n=1 Tax=Microdochium trichocladiopsis TaxID=1682393 RepID=A0A9P8XPV2_9PEZI|nr:uncharacterized protein B0I36DRAFT_300306 [Microdochium trichocladiopsis]KAH7010614.1 hypothetical protein B0I36DRAFT_300306 [Microdochium trichocladiopsis]